MTRRITGAEARELAAKASPGPWRVGACHWVRRADRTPVAKNTSPEDAALLAAAPDLAESLAAVEAERDALSRALFLSDAARDNEESAYLALLAERDALRAAARELLGAYGDFSVEYPPTIDEAARFHAALAALRETAK